MSSIESVDSAALSKTSLLAVQTCIVHYEVAQGVVPVFRPVTG